MVASQQERQTSIRVATGASLAISALEAHGVETVFGIPGVHTLALYDALHSSNIRHVLGRHEQGVGFMADGYARATGKPGVAIVITGPGITNIATPIGQAYTDSSPVLVLSSNVERPYLDGMRGSLHDLKDQMGVMAAVTQWNARVQSAAEVPRVISEAVDRLTTGRPLPVHVEIPLDVLDEEASGECSAEPAGSESAPPDPNAIELAAEALNRAKAPIIYCGGGTISAGASSEVVALAEILDAPVLTSIMGKGTIPEDHSLSAGALWSPGNEIDELVLESDCALVIGSKLGAQETQHFQLKLPETFIRIDIDAQEMHRNAEPSISILGDAKAAAQMILDALSPELVRPRANQSSRISLARKAAERKSWYAHRRDYVDALRRAIPRDGILAADMTMLSYIACRLYPVYETRTFFFPSGYGTLGFAVPAAIGAKVARPQTPVVAIVGDGGFQYTMAELGCAVQERIGIPVVIFNDATYSAVKEAQAESRGRRFIAVDLVNPDYVKLADAYGVPGVRVTSPDALVTEIRAAFDRDLPTIIDVPVEPWV